ncbi:glycine zipper family protein [Vagococcus jeotgali]|uniref:glycine zipper family protein n=1 Tax=Vagococcus jeotgali TaxID=3109030 RepID=UPI002DD997C9|nr:glycine zipper family protein [Vagococcus sp. B2T-5]
MAKKKKQETKGYYLYIGVALGLIYGVIFNKIWLGLGIGLVIGAGFDFLMKQDKKKK